MLLSRFVSSWVLVALLLATGAARADYSEHPEARAFIAQMVAEQRMDRAALVATLKKAQRRASILEAIARPAEKTKTWAEYRPIFLGRSRIKQGVRFWRENAEALAAAEARFGVPAEYVVAIVGVETRYGRVTGHYRVLDALATLAFDYPPRADFFRRELGVYLALADRYGFDPASHKGSYAGAMGLGQFMPSSYRDYAVDADGDSWPDIWDSRADAIASVAHYLARHGWQRGGYVAVRARPTGAFTPSAKPLARPSRTIDAWSREGLAPVRPVSGQSPATVLALAGPMGEEVWFGLNNFYVITRYNHSPLYALAVTQLAEAIRREYRAAGQR